MKELIKKLLSITRKFFLSDSREISLSNYFSTLIKNNIHKESLKKLVKNFEINDYTLEVIRKPSKFSANDLLSENTIKYYIVNFLAKLFYFVIPTYIWILKKP
jgi:hypothetical protein